MARLDVTPVRHRLRVPLRTAWGELRVRELLAVKVAWSETDFGVGEAAPLEPYDGVSLEAVAAALSEYADVLYDAAPGAGHAERPEYGAMRGDADLGAGHAELLAACATRCHLAPALAAIDLALWDRAGRRAGVPVARLLAADAASSVAVNATLGAEDGAGAAAQAVAAARAGFGCVKVKVGIGDDAARVAAVRAAAGEAIAIRVDANGAWSDADEAIAQLSALAPAGLEYAEEPVHGVSALRAVRAAGVAPVAMDETAGEPGAVASGAADAVCLKIARCGGISGLLRDARAARAAGSDVYVASSFDGPLGVAAGVHAAAALAGSGPVAPCGLATLALFEGLEGVLAPVRGAIAVPAGPGLLGRAGGVDCGH